MNFGRNFAKFGDFGHVRNFLTNENQNPACNTTMDQEHLKHHMWRTVRVVLQVYLSFLSIEETKTHRRNSQYKPCSKRTRQR